MKIDFIFPKWPKLLDSNPELRDTLSGYYIGDFNIPGLALETLAALTPEHIEVRLIDDHLENIDFDTEADVIAVTAFTPQATRAYLIGDRYMKQNKYVVMGGIHPTLMPEEAKKHCNSVIIGSAVDTWPVFLQDYEQGTAKPFYKGEYCSKKEGKELDFPVPKRNLFCKKGYMKFSVLLLSRGCKGRCPACVLPYIDGRNILLRPVEDVEKDLRQMKTDIVFIADEILFWEGGDYEKYSTEVFHMMKNYNKEFFATAIGITRLKSDMLKLAYDAGLRELYIVSGFPPYSLSLMNAREREKVKDALKRIKDCNIDIFLSFGLGFDYDDQSIFDKTLEFAHDLETNLVEFFIVTPYPRTPLWEKMVREERLLHTEYDKWNAANVVFKPRKMTAEELYQGYIRCWLDFYKKKTYSDLGNFYYRYSKVKTKNEIDKFYQERDERKKDDVL